MIDPDKPIPIEIKKEIMIALNRFGVETSLQIICDTMTKSAGENGLTEIIEIIKYQSEKRLVRIIKTLFWMTEHMKHREDEINGNSELSMQGGYSDELKEALKLLADLKGEG